MKTEDLKAKGLTDDQIAYVMSENGKDLKAVQDENTTLKSEKSQLENDKKVLEKERDEKAKAIADLQKNTISNDEYKAKIKEIEDNAKKENNNFILDRLLDDVLKESKVLNTENTRKSVKDLLDMTKISIADDKKSLIGAKEQLESLKKTDSHFFESTISGHSPASGVNSGSDGNVKNEGTSIAQERNKADMAPAKSNFFN